MKKTDLKFISENLINTFKIAGKTSIELYKKGLKIEIKKDDLSIKREINGRSGFGKKERTGRGKNWEKFCT